MKKLKKKTCYSQSYLFFYSDTSFMTLLKHWFIHTFKSANSSSTWTSRHFLLSSRSHSQSKISDLVWPWIQPRINSTSLCLFFFIKTANPCVFFSNGADLTSRLSSEEWLLDFEQIFEGQKTSTSWLIYGHRRPFDLSNVIVGFSSDFLILNNFAIDFS